MIYVKSMCIWQPKVILFNSIMRSNVKISPGSFCFFLELVLVLQELYLFSLLIVFSLVQWEAGWNAFPFNLRLSVSSSAESLIENAYYRFLYAFYRRNLGSSYLKSCLLGQVKLQKDTGILNLFCSIKAIYSTAIIWQIKKIWIKYKPWQMD